MARDVDWLAILRMDARPAVSVRHWKGALTKSPAKRDAKRERTEPEVAGTVSSEPGDAVATASGSTAHLLASMSHEIRTPMNGVLGMAELLADTELSAQQKMFVDVIVRSGNALLDIINDVFDIARLDAGEMVLDACELVLSDVVEETVAALVGVAADKDIAVHLRVDPALPTRLVGDQGRIRQLLENLVRFAIARTEAGDVCVDISGTAGAGILDLTVAVTGTAAIASAPEPATMAAAPQKLASRRPDGPVLGLAIASRLATLMGGGLDSDTPDHPGTLLSARLTLAVSETQPARLQAPRDIVGARVLLAGESDVARSNLAELLSHWQLSATIARSGDEALALVRGDRSRFRPFDAAVAIGSLPTSDGGQFASAVADMSSDAPPLIVLASGDPARHALHARRSHRLAVLSNPARPALLLDSLVSGIREGRDKSGISQAITTFAQDSVMNTETTDVATPESVPTKRSFGSAMARHTSDGRAGKVGVLPAVVHPSAPPVAGMPQAPQGHPSPALAGRDAAAPRMAAPDIETGPAGKDKSRPDILVAEDNEVNRMVFTQILADSGYRFDIVDNGELAVAAYEASPPRLVLMDVSMPVMNGLEATAAIRDLEAGTGEHVTIIGVTAHALKGDRDRCLAAGMDDYLPKPVSPDKLLEKVGDWLGPVQRIRKSA